MCVFYVSSYFISKCIVLISPNRPSISRVENIKHQTIPRMIISVHGRLCSSPLNLLNWCWQVVSAFFRE